MENVSVWLTLIKIQLFLLEAREVKKEVEYYWPTTTGNSKQNCEG